MTRNFPQKYMHLFEPPTAGKKKYSTNTTKIIIASKLCVIVGLCLIMESFSGLPTEAIPSACFVGFMLAVVRALDCLHSCACVLCPQPRDVSAHVLMHARRLEDVGHMCQCAFCRIHTPIIAPKRCLAVAEIIQEKVIIN
jgi:hypothetical protein